MNEPDTHATVSELFTPEAKARQIASLIEQARVMRAVFGEPRTLTRKERLSNRVHYAHERLAHRIAPWIGPE